MNEEREQLEYLKENYTVATLLEAQKNNEIDVEALILPTSFKRLGFMKGDSYAVGLSDFYGNIVVETERPKLISAISLMTIHRLMELKYDRYNTIMAIKRICQNNTSTEDVLKEIASIIPQVEAQEE